MQALKALIVLGAMLATILALAYGEKIVHDAWVYAYPHGWYIRHAEGDEQTLGGPVDWLVSHRRFSTKRACESYISRRYREFFILLREGKSEAGGVYCSLERISDANSEVDSPPW